MRGCFVVYRGGDDRLCPIHQQEQAVGDIGQSMAQFAIDMASQPGFPPADGGDASAVDHLT